jgi:hypothetical protein
MMTWACSPEAIEQDGASTSSRSIAGAYEEPHDALDAVCQSLDGIQLMSEDGSTIVNKCFSAGNLVTCAAGQFPWGQITLKEGAIGTMGYIDIDFVMAPGWFGQSTRWKVTPVNDFTITTTGLPALEGDWATQFSSPLRNNWSLRFPSSAFPASGFYLAMTVQAVRINLMGSVVPGSSTTLWGKFAVPTNPAQAYTYTSSPYIAKFIPQNCTAAQLVPTQICKTLKIGAPALSNFLTISANTTGLAGTLSYVWSTGSTSPSIIVSPQTTTTYSVTVSSNGVPVGINEINVNVFDVSCGNGNGNNPHHKVTVCHYPPGNPANMQEICIDWSGVPAHVAMYRPAGSFQGHDSGCKIGRCADNPCQ